MRWNTTRIIIRSTAFRRPSRSLASATTSRFIRCSLTSASTTPTSPIHFSPNNRSTNAGRRWGRARVRKRKKTPRITDAHLKAVETTSLLFSSCRLSFASNGLTLGFVRFHEIGRRCSFERQSIANFPHDALLQRLNKVDAGIAARNFRRFQVQLGECVRPAERLTAQHNFSNHSPFVSGTRREWLWVQQERLRSSRSSAITPGGKDSVAGRNARGEVGHILERRTIRRHNYTGK